MAAAGRLRAALEQTAASLASAELEPLLASEAAVEQALRELSSAEALTVEERSAVGDELARAGGALLRCRRLGASLADFVRTSLHAQGRDLDYGPRAVLTPAYGTRAIDTRA